MTSLNNRKLLDFDEEIRRYLLEAAYYIHEEDNYDLGENLLNKALEGNSSLMKVLEEDEHWISYLCELKDRKPVTLGKCYACSPNLALKCFIGKQIDKVTGMYSNPIE
jgi:hypothetical protein